MELIISGQITTIIDGDRISSWFLINAERQMNFIGENIQIVIEGSKYNVPIQDLILNDESVADKEDAKQKIKYALRQ